MNVVIVEDEISASEQLEYLIKSINPDINVIKVLETVKSSIAYFFKPIDIDLIFMDIHLADGLSFEIFDHIELDIPIIFTTAYNEYALKAFKVNSIDYLLKPIQKEELINALKKFDNISQPKLLNSKHFEDVLQMIQRQNKTYKANYLISHRDELIPLQVEDIAFFYIDTGLVKVVTFANKEYVIDKKLEDLENELSPKEFDRANRQYIINRKAIQKIKIYFGGKLIVNTNPANKERIVISKAKATQFKNWVNT